MAFEYPDIMNDVVDALKRYESGTVQYLAEPPRDVVAAGDVAQVRLVLQNVMDVPVNVAIHIALPEADRKLKRLPQPLFQIFRSDVQFELAQGEVAELVIPIHVQPHVPADEYRFAFHVRSQATQEGMRVRPDHGVRRVGEIKIRHPQGMRISQIASWGYEAQQASHQAFPIVIGNVGEPPEQVDLKPAFNSLWTPADWDLISGARQEVNERRIYTVPALTAEAVYLPFMQESQVFFGDSGVKLHIGEAIFLSKMLTHTVAYLMGNAEWQDCLLVPIYAYALASEQPTDDVISLVTQLGYTHVIELAASLSFALVEDTLGRAPWNPAEQRIVREFISGCLSEGSTLPEEFLYLPLILGGLAIADQVTFAGEDVAESVRLLGKAKSERAELFAEEDLRDLNDAFDRLIARQARGRGRS